MSRPKRDLPQQLDPDGEKIPIADIVEAMNASDGSYPKAVELLAFKYPDVTEDYVRHRVIHSPQLRATHNVKSPKRHIPDDKEVATRNGDGTPTSDVVAANPMLAGEVGAQDTRLLMQGLKASGLSDSSIEKLETLGKFTVSGGRMVASTLELTNRMMVVSTAQVFDKIDQLEQLMANCDMSKEDGRAEYAGWLRMQSQLRDILLKSNDRAQSGMESLFKMQMALKNAGKGKTRSNARQGPSSIYDAEA